MRPRPVKGQRKFAGRQGASATGCGRRPLRSGRRANRSCMADSGALAGVPAESGVVTIIPDGLDHLQVRALLAQHERVQTAREASVPEVCAARSDRRAYALPVDACDRHSGSAGDRNLRCQIGNVAVLLGTSVRLLCTSASSSRALRQRLGLARWADCRPPPARRARAGRRTHLPSLSPLHTARDTSLRSCPLPAAASARHCPARWRPGPDIRPACRAGSWTWIARASGQAQRQHDIWDLHDRFSSKAAPCRAFVRSASTALPRLLSISRALPSRD